MGAKTLKYARKSVYLHEALVIQAQKLGDTCNAYVRQI